MKNVNAKLLLYKFFSLCFNSGINPTEWDNNDIIPIPKKDKEARDPLQNRCITIMCCVAKIYSSILNSRLQKFLEVNNILEDEQNGFRASRSCIDHLLVLCTILRNRKSLGLDTFLTYIDFQKAFDSVERGLLLFKLSEIGVIGKFYDAIKSMYNNPKSRILLNEYETNYFDCKMGVKQGDSISPTLFSIFINDLAKEIKNAKIGLNLNENLHENFKMDTPVFVSILLYADDIVLLTSSETDMQDLLLIVEIWCKKWRLEVNLTKTNVMHVRDKKQQQSNFMFLFDCKPVPYCTSYKYLGSTINEFLDYNCTVQIQAENAGKALASIITKMIKNGGFPYNVYTAVVESCVDSVAHYGSAVFGFAENAFLVKLHLRSARAFLGLPRNVCTEAAISDMAWLETKCKTRLNMIRQYHRVIKLSESRLTRKIYNWDLQFSNNFPNKTTWTNEIKTIFIENNYLSTFEAQLEFPLKTTINQIKQSMFNNQTISLKDKCLQKPKLRTYNLFNDFENAPDYVSRPLSFVQRRAIAKTRTGCLPLRLETARYERPRVPAELRYCKACGMDEDTEMRNAVMEPDQLDKKIESETHFLFWCGLYSELRKKWLGKVAKAEHFDLLSIGERYCTIFSSQNVKFTAQFIIDSFDLRSKKLNK